MTNERPAGVIRARRSVARAPILSAVLLGLLLAPGCVSVPKRNALPLELLPSAVTVGGPDARGWGDSPPHDTDYWLSRSDAALREEYGGIIGRPHTYLAISGGGANGAFGAGLLCGWTEAGDRPEFTYVTGISTGALIAPFAFLGSGYDDRLRELYTSVSTKDIVKKRSALNIVTSDAATSSEPLKALLAKHVDRSLMEAIAAEHRTGRRLKVATTNLDAQRPVHWDIGHIATSGDPGALDLIRQVLLASASIPGVFPPVLIDVTAEGEAYDEMHVDGGASAQVFLYPAGLDWERILDRLDVPGMPDVYVIRNSRLEPVYTATKNKIFSISGRSVSSLIRTQGIGNMFEIYLMGKRDGLDYHLAYIPDGFDEKPAEQFDPVYMKKLFELGHESALGGYPWEKAPPGYAIEAE